MIEYAKRLGWFVRMAALTGPWQPVVLYACRRMRAPPRYAADATTCVPDLDPLKTAEVLDLNGWAQEFRVPAQQIDEILAFLDRTPQQRYDNPHLQCEALRALVSDPRVLDVARRYLRSEPNLYDTIVWRNGAVKNPELVKQSHLYRFHFDVADVKSLALFVYLTDVDEQCGPHEVITGTHGRKSLWQTARIYVDDEDAYERYPGRATLILGPRGTAFFEEQTAYHRQSMPKKPRVMLRVTYTLWRTPREA